VNGFILDTNVFNRAVDGGIRLPDLPSDLQYFATHVQLDELTATKDEIRRNALLEQFVAVGPMPLPTESFVYDVSRWDLAKWGDGILFPQIKALLDARNHAKSSNTQDALVAETAIKNSLTLVSEDSDLLQVVSQIGGSAIRVSQIDPSRPHSEVPRSKTRGA
jgi:hypothetical protein